MKSQFEVYLRLKPSNKSQSQNAMQYQIYQNKKLQVLLPKHVKFGLINNSRDNLDFNFTHVFDQKSSQEHVFTNVTTPVINSFLDGYNATIFAYGQTGSGKTYTMSGAETWQLRGIIPRTLSYIFDEIDKRNKFEYKIYISFMEIYNENAYDLLEKKHLETPLEQWNKIALYEDDQNNIHLKNLSIHQCNNEQEGIDLLMMGNFIRQVSSTPMNQSSSRSHCIFTVTLEGYDTTSETCFVSKLHLVDLAGSERISKSQVEGNLLNEAKYINLSLTYLEQVIIALNERMKGANRQHIPYRNSLMTTLLKDSLGGNCKTVMIATISSENDNIEESLSTLRFSQRVGQLENEIRRNEKVDLEAVVKRLEQEKLVLIRELEQYQRGGASTSSNKKIQSQQQNLLPQSNGTPISQKDIQEKVELYLNERIPMLDVKSIEETQKCFEAMKDLYNTRMKEYVTELTFISEKLQKYDEILTRKKEQSSFLEQKENSSPEAEIYRRNESPQITFKKRANQ
ncbi:unnamed protein product (macronuclear) [Paramecium tetraurelia]|uniref:Kinesin-like protein n=1 Tax=Paramecium tetraurelia TaxID=5888 RepID=A0DKE4_PARTE|nr:uncharacterized protein GSPATT00017840001 [Paramecium tetraurelia]CAK83511.1 unnamed protein product [Paramecium tetraurelia]|eukprot:XP_001450908.1 hypothetical protein (macronuclear) [Paramecium tetraurelia strain d4-2]